MSGQNKVQGSSCSGQFSNKIALAGSGDEDSLSGENGANNSNADTQKVVWKEVRGGIVKNLILWAGETTFAILPIITFYVVRDYSTPPLYAALCDKALKNCVLESAAPLAEMNIIGVIISGMGVLSLLEFENSKPNISKTNLFTYVAGLFQLVVLVVGSILYAFETAGIAHNSTVVTERVFLFSLVLSCYLTLARGWNSAFTRSD